MSKITEADVDRIVGMRDPVLRNLKITQAYYELSSAVARDLPGDANWCTFAAWASRQAGQTIRQDDLEARIREYLDESSGVATVLGEILEGFGRWSRRATPGSIVGELAPAAKLDRSSLAMGKGNLKVFAEIGREFARYLLGPGSDTTESEERIAAFCAGLTQGEPPRGQSMLRQAFRDLYRARFETDTKTRAELILSANLRMGYHEQMRLQPEIFAALNAAVADVAAVRRRVLDAVFHGSNRFVGWLGRSYLGVTAPLDRLWIRLTNHLRRIGRGVVSETLMSLRLPAETLRLGEDLRRSPPGELTPLENAELRAFASRIGALAEPSGRSAEDWADFQDRMRFIARFLLLYQRERSLLEERPFGPAVTDAIREGRVPDGPLW